MEQLDELKHNAPRDADLEIEMAELGEKAPQLKQYQSREKKCAFAPSCECDPAYIDW